MKDRKGVAGSRAAPLQLSLVVGRLAPGGRAPAWRSPRGTLGYIVVEGWELWDAFYMTVITVTTVGYREVQPLSRAMARSSPSCS